MPGDDPACQCRTGASEMRTLASPCYGGIYHRFRTECGSSRQLRAGTELYRLGLWTIRVHRQILFGSRETHSGVYRSGSTDGDVIVGAPDLAGSEKHGLPVPLSRDRTCLVLWPVCHRLYAKPVFPGTCRLVQNSECGKNYVFHVVIFKRDLLVRLA